MNVTKAINEVDTKPDSGMKLSAKDHKRGDILLEAGRLITGDRAEQYGNFKDQMESIAGMYKALHIGIPMTGNLDEKGVAEIMMLLKMRRAITSDDTDSVVDLCGYAALYGEHFK